ncbi:hypothetical protein AAC387_Pa03g3026 [Persea americana]
MCLDPFFFKALTHLPSSFSETRVPEAAKIYCSIKRALPSEFIQTPSSHQSEESRRESGGLQFLLRDGILPLSVADANSIALEHQLLSSQAHALLRRTNHNNPNVYR